MKKFLLLITVSILAVSLVAGCEGDVKTYIDASKPIITRVDQEFIIAVDFDPTTDYVWQELHDVTMLSLERDKYEPDEKAEGLVGAGGTRYYQYKALRKGDTEVILLYLRPWEAEDAKESIFKVTIK